MTRALPAADDIERAAQATAALADLASLFLTKHGASAPDERELNADTRYRALVEQMPAVVFVAYLDEGIGEAYVSPQIEKALGFSQREWLEDPIRWFQRIHPDDKARWSVEAAELFVTGGPLRSAYRVLARDGRVCWFHCQAAMIRRADGRPWFIQGVGIDITDLKEAEAALQEERNLFSAILETVGALVAVLDPGGRIVRFNRACERASGLRGDAVEGRLLSELFETPEERHRFAALITQWRNDVGRDDVGRDDVGRHDPGRREPGPADHPEHEGCWVNDRGDRRIIAWSATTLRGADGRVEYIIASGNDVTERKRLERALLEISGREQRRIGQALHDGLGQHLTGTAFLSKVLEQRLEDQELPEATEARALVKLVNEAIEKTRELSRGLIPVVSHADGLMTSLQRFAGEVEDLFSVSCRFVCDRPVLLDDVAAATHLFHITQEAVSNAIKHGRAGRIVIALSALDDTGRLAIEDDGVGIGKVEANHTGMGLHIMSYRATMIGGSLDVRRVTGGAAGTTVDCVFPMRTRE